MSKAKRTYTQRFSVSELEDELCFNANGDLAGHLCCFGFQNYNDEGGFAVDISGYVSPENFYQGMVCGTDSTAWIQWLREVAELVERGEVDEETLGQ